MEIRFRCDYKKFFPNKSSLQFVWSSFSTSNFYCKCDQVLTKINEQSVSNRCFNSLVVFSNLCVRCYISVTKFFLILDEAMTVDPAVQHWAHHCTVDLDLVVLSVFSRSLVWIKEFLKDQKYFSSISKCHLNFKYSIAITWVNKKWPETAPWGHLYRRQQWAVFDNFLLLHSFVSCWNQVLDQSFLIVQKVLITKPWLQTK